MKKILLVEDDQFLSELYVEILKEGGYEVSWVADGEKGYQEMKKGGYDLVLLDVMLPKLDGLEILQKLKAGKQLKKNKVIFLLTNLSGEAIVRKKGRLQVDEYLIKSSLTPDKLLAKIKSYLS
jgi:DNA-binding response OmpR family regulator